jgi:hypothetical protein
MGDMRQSLAKMQAWRIISVRLLRCALLCDAMIQKASTG